MRFAERHAGLQHVNSSLEALEVDVVDGLLSFGETVAHRHGRGEVAGIVHRAFGTGIKQEDIPFLQRVDEAMVVEHLSLHGGNGREGECIAFATAGLLDDGSHFCLVDAWTYGLIGSQMHAGRHVDSLVDDGDFFFIFVDALTNDGFHHLL